MNGRDGALAPSAPRTARRNRGKCRCGGTFEGFRPLMRGRGSRSTASLPHALQQGTKHLPDVLRQNAMAFGGGMNPIGLIQLRSAADAFQKKRDEGGFVRAREIGED